MFLYAQIDSTGIYSLAHFPLKLGVKVDSAVFALHRGSAVVIADGTKNTGTVISDIVSGKRIGTFFTQHLPSAESVMDQARSGQLSRLYSMRKSV